MRRARVLTTKDMAPPRRGRSARDGATAGGGDGVRSSDDAVVGRIDALAAENSALAAENRALAATCDALAADVGLGFRV